MHSKPFSHEAQNTRRICFKSTIKIGEEIVSNCQKLLKGKESQMPRAELDKRMLACLNHHKFKRVTCKLMKALETGRPSESNEEWNMLAKYCEPWVVLIPRVVKERQPELEERGAICLNRFVATRNDGVIDIEDYRLATDVLYSNKLSQTYALKDPKPAGSFVECMNETGGDVHSQCLALYDTEEGRKEDRFAGYLCRYIIIASANANSLKRKFEENAKRMTQQRTPLSVVHKMDVLQLKNLPQKTGSKSSVRAIEAERNIFEVLADMEQCFQEDFARYHFQSGLKICDAVPDKTQFNVLMSFCGNIKSDQNAFMDLNNALLKQTEQGGEAEVQKQINILVDLLPAMGNFLDPYEVVQTITQAVVFMQDHSPEDEPDPRIDVFMEIYQNLSERFSRQRAKITLGGAYLVDDPAAYIQGKDVSIPPGIKEVSEMNEMMEASVDGLKMEELLKRFMKIDSTRDDLCVEPDCLRRRQEYLTQCRRVIQGLGIDPSEVDRIRWFTIKMTLEEPAIVQDLPKMAFLTMIEDMKGMPISTSLFPLMNANVRLLRSSIESEGDRNEIFPKIDELLMGWMNNLEAKLEEADADTLRVIDQQIAGFPITHASREVRNNKNRIMKAIREKMTTKFPSEDQLPKEIESATVIMLKTATGVLQNCMEARFAPSENSNDSQDVKDVSDVNEAIAVAFKTRLSSKAMLKAKAGSKIIFEKFVDEDWGDCRKLVHLGKFGKFDILPPQSPIRLAEPVQKMCSMSLVTRLENAMTVCFREKGWIDGGAMLMHTMTEDLLTCLEDGKHKETLFVCQVPEAFSDDNPRVLEVCNGWVKREFDAGCDACDLKSGNDPSKCTNQALRTACELMNLYYFYYVSYEDREICSKVLGR